MDTPEAAAIGWLIAYRSADWTDQRASAWIDRVRPFVTDSMNRANETLRDGGGGADWDAFVRLRCTSTVTDTNAVIPMESPGSGTLANVQVSGTVRTTCTAGSPTTPTESVAATVVALSTPAGWRIDRKIF